MGFYWAQGSAAALDMRAVSDVYQSILRAYDMGCFLSTRPEYNERSLFALAMAVCSCCFMS